VEKEKGVERISMLGKKITLNAFDKNRRLWEKNDSDQKKGGEITDNVEGGKQGNQSKGKKKKIVNFRWAKETPC